MPCCLNLCTRFLHLHKRARARSVRSVCSIHEPAFTLLPCRCSFRYVPAPARSQFLLSIGLSATCKAAARQRHGAHGRAPSSWQACLLPTPHSTEAYNVPPLSSLPLSLSLSVCIRHNNRITSRMERLPHDLHATAPSLLLPARMM